MGLGAVLSRCGLISASPDDRVRRRKEGQSAREWLMGSSADEVFKCQFDASGFRVYAENNASVANSYEANVPPRLAWDGVSFGFGILGSKLASVLLPDIVIRPKPVVIDASPEDVWRVLLDFDKYPEWNPFHRRVRVVDQPGGKVAVHLTVDLGPLLGVVESEETVYYVDEKRHIFAYGIGREGPSCLRTVWLVPAPADGRGGGPRTVFHSWDTIGGIPAVASRGHIHSCVIRGFEAQHLAIRDRCHLIKAGDDNATRLPRGLVTNPPSLGVCVVTGGCGFLGSHMARLLRFLDSARVSAVHVIDVRPPTDEMLQSRLKGVHVHVASITDAAAIDALFASIRPTTVLHAASLIDLRDDAASARACEAVNVDATRSLLALAEKHGCTRFVYTSTIEYAYIYNRSEQAEEDRYYPAHPTNPYQRTKIAAERLVLEANSARMTTVTVRPAHIFGDPLEDNLRFLGDVAVCFGEATAGVSFDAARAGARMSMVHVENCALIHLLAAVRCRDKAEAPVGGVAGRKFNAVDFDENIVCVYRAMKGRPPPLACLPYWFLAILVRVSMVLDVLLLWLSLGTWRLLPPMSGLHDGALAAAQECTIRGPRTRRLLGYTPVVSRATAIAAAARPLVVESEAREGRSGSSSSATHRVARHLIGASELHQALSRNGAE